MRSFVHRRSARRSDKPHQVDVHVGSRIRQRRIELHISQEKLAAAIGVTFQQVQKYERGSNRISAGRLYRLSRILDVAVEFFYDGLAPDSAADAAPGFSEAPAAAFEHDPLGRRETIELVEAYYGIDDPAVRRRLFELARTLAETSRRDPDA